VQRTLAAPHSLRPAELIAVQQTLGGGKWRAEGLEAVEPAGGNDGGGGGVEFGAGF
jgi:hypothetical protein